MSSYDVIVLGVGSMGSAAAYELASRGHRVLGLEQFSIPHTQGSHAGSSRMIRLAYFEHPDYVALLRRAYERWHQLEEASGEKLLHITGGLYLGRPDSELVDGSIQAAKAYDLPHEVIGPAELRKRFPQFRVPEETVAFYETQAGMLLPEAVVSTQAELAMRSGAVLRGHEPALSWKAQGSGVEVRTASDTYRAKSLIITAGAWSGQVLKELKVDLKVTRQAMVWFWPRKPMDFALGTFPSWALDLTDRASFRGVHYGFPMLPPSQGNPGLKAALHWPDEVCDPDAVDRSIRAADVQAVREAIERYIPDGCGPVLAARTCIYTNTSDGHFIVDHHPEHDNVTIACGFSGHGFKFVSVMGQVLADLATKGTTVNPIKFLSLSRFQ